MLKNAKHLERICPSCRVKMIKGSLRDAHESIYVTSLQSMDHSPLRAMICPKCGYVELVASHPEKLDREDFPLD